MCPSRATGGELHDKIKTKRREGRQIEPGIGELLKVAEMVGPASARMFEREVGRVAPTVGLAAEKGHPLHRAWLARKGRKIRRQRRQRELVDRPVPVVVPRPERGGGEKGESEGEQGTEFHGGLDGAGRGTVAMADGDFGRSVSSTAA